MRFFERLKRHRLQIFTSNQPKDFAARHWMQLYERAQAEADRNKSWLFDAWKTMAGQTRGLQRQRRIIKRLRSECICAGNWRLIVRESEPLLDKPFTAPDGDVWHLFGIVHGSDDIYYGMCRNGQIKLLSCVGSLASHGYELRE